MSQSEVEPLKCANCGALFRAVDLYCPECGVILPQAFTGDSEFYKAATNPLDSQVSLKEALHWGTGYFHYRAKLSLQIGTTDLVIPVEIGSAPIVIGRRGGSVVPHIDLTAYGAFDMGISRYHAQLQREHETLMITDLGSNNGTFLNRERLDPQTPTQLYNRALLQLGKMLLRVRFS